MPYFVVGATSNTGDAVITRLAKKVGGAQIRCLVRPTSPTGLLQQLGIAMHVGDVLEPASYAAQLTPETIYLDMSHPKHYHISLDTVKKAGVRRAYFVTSTGVFSQYRRCASIYEENEEKIRNSGINYTIIRPSMIYGSLRDRNMIRLIRFLDRLPIYPLFGEGTNLMQPVFFEDLADGIVATIDNPKSARQEYNLAGPEALTYREILETIIRLLDRRVALWRVHPGLAYRLVQVLQYLPKFPIKDEQVLRMREDKTFDITKAQADLAFQPRAFHEGIALEVAAYRATRGSRP